MLNVRLINSLVLICQSGQQVCRRVLNVTSDGTATIESINLLELSQCCCPSDHDISGRISIHMTECSNNVGCTTCDFIDSCTCNGPGCFTPDGIDISSSNITSRNDDRIRRRIGIEIGVSLNKLSCRTGQLGNEAAIDISNTGCALNRCNVSGGCIRR